MGPRLHYYYFQVTLPWFYAHWILIGSLSRVLLVELFTANSPGIVQFPLKPSSNHNHIMGYIYQ